MHLGKNEASKYKAGSCIETFEYRGFTFGIQLCIDTHIPEMTLVQKLKGGEIIAESDLERDVQLVTISKKNDYNKKIDYLSY